MLVVTILEAEVDPDRSGTLIDRFCGERNSLPSELVESSLVESSGRWRIITTWRDAAALEAYRSRVGTPEGVLMFRDAGAEPSLTQWTERAHLKH